MSVWTEYSQQTPKGTAGSLYDLTEHAVDTFNNTEADGVLNFGVGVVRGTDPANEIALPVAASTANEFVGVVMNGGTHEMDMSGNSRIVKNYSVSVMRYGRVWVRLVDGEEPVANDPVHLVVSGDDAGSFKTAEEAGSTIQIKAKFLGTKSSNGVAAIELYNQMQE